MRPVACARIGLLQRPPVADAGRAQWIRRLQEWQSVCRVAIKGHSVPTTGRKVRSHTVNVATSSDCGHAPAKIPLAQKALRHAPIDAAHSEAAERSRAIRMMLPSLALVSLSALTVALHVRDPHRPGSWGGCAIHAATGLYCPVCGGLRAVNNLTYGDFAAALSSNLMVAILAPLVAIRFLVWTADRWYGRRRPTRGTNWSRAFWLLLASFAIVRNLPFGAWLAP